MSRVYLNALIKFFSYWKRTNTIYACLPFLQIPLWLHSPGHATDIIDSRTGTPLLSVRFWKVLFCDSSLKQSAFNPSLDAIAHDVVFVNLIINVMVNSYYIFHTFHRVFRKIKKNESTCMSATQSAMAFSGVTLGTPRHAL